MADAVVLITLVEGVKFALVLSFVIERLVLLLAAPLGDACFGPPAVVLAPIVALAVLDAAPSTPGVARNGLTLEIIIWEISCNRLGNLGESGPSLSVQILEEVRVVADKSS